MNLDITASFVDVENPTPFGYYDADPQFQRDADGMVRYVYSKLGGRTLGIEMWNQDVYASFEEALLEYSAMVNSAQAKSTIAGLIGSSTGSMLQDGRVPNPSLGQAVRQAGAYSSEAMVGGNRTLYSGSITLKPGQQKYDLQYYLSQSGQLSASQRIQVEKILYFSPANQYRFYDSNSALNYLNSEFKFESFTPETVFYMLPVWEDVLRSQAMQMSNKIRRSNYSWNLINNELLLYPTPTVQMPIYFQYYLIGEDPWKTSQPGVTTNISNVPFGNLQYSSVNALGHQWIKRFALALSKEVLGQVRSKMQDIPIPDGTLTLNGPDLIQQAREEQQYLRQELRELLDSMTYQQLAQNEMNAADALQRQLSKVPTLIFVG